MKERQDFKIGNSFMGVGGSIYTPKQREEKFKEDFKPVGWLLCVCFCVLVLIFLFGNILCLIEWIKNLNRK